MENKARTHSPRLEASLRAWNTPGFKPTLKHEVEALGSRLLPLQQAVTLTSVALDEPVTVIVQESGEDEDCIRVMICVFFEGIVPGCSCADDPTPVEPQNEYGEFELRIDKATAETRAEVVG